MRKIDRRDFLRAGPAAAGVAALVAGRAGALAAAAQGKAPSSAADVKISSTAYTPIADYPIQPKRYSDVKITDRFWGPKIALNAEVTIPLEVEKLTTGDRGLNGNILEAAILSLKTHPNARLQSVLDARVQELRDAPGRGNGGFEVAATYYQTTGKRDLLDPAIRTASALYDDFVA